MLKVLIVLNILWLEIVVAKSTYCSSLNISKHDKVTAQADASLPYYDWIKFDKKKLNKI